MKRNPYLRVKIKSLAEESRIIRTEERKANRFKNYSLQNELRHHRVGIVRSEAHATLVAYQYLRGKPYDVKSYGDPSGVNWEAVKRMVKKYGRIDLNKDAWINGEELRTAA